MDGVRINKYIASTGFSSRRTAEKYITDGRVKINGQVVTELGKIVLKDDVVQIDNIKINIENEKVYIMLNKPKGYITTSREQFNRPSVLDIIKTDKRVYPVGRLDMDSEGLLILTNDGDFTNNVIHPTKHISKTYEVVLKDEINNNTILKLEQGIDIGGYITKPCIIKRISKNKVLITIFEGKNRQIRRMIEAVDNKVVLLKRLAIGKLELNDLKPGEYVFLDQNQINKIFE